MPVNKCATFQIVTTNTSWYVKDPKLEALDGSTIKFLNATGPLIYLGIETHVKYL